MEYLTECELCGNEETACMEYHMTANNTISRPLVCKKCANDMGLETDEEAEIRNRIWWRNHLKMRLGKELTDEEFEYYYRNRNNSIIL